MTTKTLTGSPDDPDVTYTNTGRTRAIGPAYLMVVGAVVMVRAADGSLDERRIGTVSPIRVGKQPPWKGRQYRLADLTPEVSSPPPATMQRRGAGAAGSWNIPGRDPSW